MISIKKTNPVYGMKFTVANDRASQNQQPQTLENDAKYVLPTDSNNNNRLNERHHTASSSKVSLGLRRSKLSRPSHELVVPSTNQSVNIRLEKLVRFNSAVIDTVLNFKAFFRTQNKFRLVLMISREPQVHRALTFSIKINESGIDQGKQALHEACKNFSDYMDANAKISGNCTQIVLS